MRREHVEGFAAAVVLFLLAIAGDAALTRPAPSWGWAPGGGSGGNGRVYVQTITQDGSGGGGGGNAGVRSSGGFWGDAIGFGTCYGGGGGGTLTKCCDLYMSAEVYAVPERETFVDGAPRNTLGDLLSWPIGARIRYPKNQVGTWPVEVNVSPGTIFRLTTDESAAVLTGSPITIMAWQPVTVCVDRTWNRDEWKRWIDEPQSRKLGYDSSVGIYKAMQ